MVSETKSEPFEFTDVEQGVYQAFLDRPLKAATAVAEFRRLHPGLRIIAAFTTQCANPYNSYLTIVTE